MTRLVRRGIIQRGSRDDVDEGKAASSEILREIAARWLKSTQHLLLQAREHQYRDIEPGIMFEEFLQFNYEMELFLFNGTCRIAMVHMRKPGDEGPVGDGYRLYDRDWHRLEPVPAAW